MLMMLQNLGNAASPVVVDTTEYIAVAAQATVGAQGADGSVAVEADEGSVTVETE